VRALFLCAHLLFNTDTRDNMTTTVAKYWDCKGEKIYRTFRVTKFDLFIAAI
jgi:hypothetical protein